MRRRRKRKQKSYLPFIICIIGVLILIRLIWGFNSSLDLVSYAEDYGWKVDESTKKYEEVTIPEKFAISEEAYNILQKDIDSDLNDYKGKKADMYTYKVKERFIKVNNKKLPLNIAMIVYDDKVIAGSVYSDYLKGCEVSLKGRSLEQIEGMSVEQWKEKIAKKFK
jgi:hypothetical protein